MSTDSLPPASCYLGKLLNFSGLSFLSEKWGMMTVELVRNPIRG